MAPNGFGLFRITTKWVMRVTYVYTHYTTGIDVQELSVSQRNVQSAVSTGVKRIMTARKETSINLIVEMGISSRRLYIVVRNKL